MPTIPVSDEVLPYKPPRRVRADIGDIIRSGAEIDHLLNLAMFKLIDINFREGFALLGRTTLGATLAKVRYFMSVNSEEKTWAEFQKYDSAMEPWVQIRNTIAHGVIMGMKNDAIMFLMTANHTDNLGNFCNDVNNPRESDIALAASNGRKFEEWTRALFNVRPLHETIQYRVLVDKPTSLKAQRRSGPSKWELYTCLTQLGGWARFSPSAERTHAEAFR